MFRFFFNLVSGVLLYFYDAFERILNLKFPYRLHLFEWCDLWYVPTTIKHHCQLTFTAQWHHRLPLLQSHPPTHHATHLITQILSNMTDSSTTPYTIIDFCSGAGGPLPAIERTINASRLRSSLPPIQFRLSDLVPNLEAWIPLAAQSEYLSFIPQPVDAVDPPASTISVSARNDDVVVPSALEGRGTAEEIMLDGRVRVDPELKAQRERERESVMRGLTAGTKVMHLFCLSFHHFGDEQARVVVRNALGNSDAFCFLELQERSLGCLGMMMLEGLLLLVVSWWWFWGEWVHLLLVYGVPVLPVVHAWDGVVSCLRTRTFEEVRGLVDGVIAEEKRRMEKELTFIGQVGGRRQGVARGEWTVSEARVRHTWPAGYLNAVIGIRKEIRKGMD
ncbi:hypothetical protein BDZ85DRAFT_22067 [Elsinoe ampelina]|uniref:Uncharacterized protein n=1 Tax=Elsinoe ampelina TaxID=302913 RepID=A0A6A6G5N4_9PEZI|nr:hypothetical protein BDZ85DRAFT_22067 [Elsinoe ampelina]